MEPQEIRQIIHETDNGTIRYECGHGADKIPENERKHSTRFCDLCLSDLPPMARRDMLRKERITVSANVARFREQMSDSIRHLAFIEFLKSPTSDAPFYSDWLKMNEEEQANWYAASIQEGAKAQYEAIHNL